MDIQKKPNREERKKLIKQRFNMSSGEQIAKMINKHFKLAKEEEKENINAAKKIFS